MPRVWVRRRGEERWRARPAPVDFERCFSRALEGGAAIRAYECGELAGWRALADTIPSRVRVALGRFGQGRWELLRLAARVPHYLELLESNPALGFLLGHGAAFRRPVPSDAPITVDHLVRMRRQDILTSLGFCSEACSEGVVRLLARLPADIVNVPRLLRLRRSLASTKVRHLLAHVPSPNRLVLDVVSEADLLPTLTVLLLRDLVAAAGASGGSPIRLLRDTAVMWRLLRGRPGEEPRFVSLRQVQRLHDELARQITCNPASLLDGPPLPPAPVPGTATIVPLDTVEELVSEAREQENCAPSYVPRIRSGFSYLYRMLQPERATLELCCVHGEWRLAEVLGRRNQRVQGNARAAALEWLVGAGWHIPAPPVPGTDSILPLRSYLAILEEERQMRIPLRPELAAICGGRRYLYRVLEPSRCTLVLERVGRRFVPLDLRGAEGGSVPVDTIDKVLGWLRQAVASQG